MPPKKFLILACLLTTTGLLLKPPLTAADAPVQGAEPAGARGGFGRGGRGGPMTPEDQAAIAKLADLPAWSARADDGSYAVSPPYSPAPENAARENVPHGKVVTFQMDMTDSRFFPPTPGRGGGAPPTTREVNVYVPAQYVAGTAAPLLFCHDAMGMHDNKPAPYLPDILDNLIADKRVPAMIAVMVMPSNQRNLEYDTVSGKFAEFVEAEVLPRVAQECNVSFTTDPNARATLGGSSGGAAALSMAWFHPELYRRVLAFSGSFVRLRTDPVTAPHGAWEYHENLIPQTTPNKPLRLWLEVGEHDNGATSSSAGLGNWVIANLRMADALQAKGYHYQFVYARAADHVDRPVRAQLLAPALEWLWRDFRSKDAR